MKHSILIFVACLSLFFVACSDESSNIPLCVQDQIDFFKSTHNDCINSRITKTDLEGQIVYVLSQGTCISDGLAYVLTEQCDTLCLLFGIAGKRDCNGIDWLEGDVEELEIIWEN